MLRRNPGLYIIVCIGILLFSGCGEASQDPCINTADTILERLEAKDGFDIDNIKRLHGDYCSYTAVECMQLLNMVLAQGDLPDEEFQFRQDNLQLIKDLINSCGCPDNQVLMRHIKKRRELCEKAAEKAAELDIQV